MALDIKTYWEQRLTKTFDLSGVGYLALGESYNNWLYRIRKHIFHRCLKFIVIDLNTAAVLDIGSGTGFYVEQWQEAGDCNIVGIDITSVAVQMLRSKFSDHKFYEIDITEDISSLGKQKFDVVSAFDVLFHIVDDDLYEAALTNIYSVLKPGGWLLFSDNFVHHQAVTTLHQRSRQINMISQMLSKAGFTETKRFPMFYLMNGPVDTDSRLLKKWWRLLLRVTAKGEAAGFIIGFLLYPLELLLISMMQESPTTEVMICKKPA